MPRPKRTKITSIASTAPGRVAKPAPRKQQPKPSAAPPAKQSREAPDSLSDDSDGLVTKSKSTRPRRKMPGQKTPEPVGESELFMTGGLPTAEDGPLASDKDRTPASAVSKATRTSRSAKSSTRGPSGKDTQEEPAPEGDTSGFGDLTFSSLGSESPAHGTRPPSAMKVGATPAREASILALTNFKRRPRQLSSLRMMQQHTDAEDNDQSGLDDTDNLDFDDFLPHAESTPLNVRKNASEAETRNDSGTQVSSSGSRGVKRKLSPVVQVPRSSPPCDSPPGTNVESVRSSSSSLPEIMPSREEIVAQTQDEAEPLSDTFAPPMSSSPVREVSRPVQTPVQARNTRKGRSSEKAPTYNESDAEETETPAKAKRKSKSKPLPNMSTAQLKSLLPRRRNRTLRDRDEFDMDSSEATPVDSDQDELQLPDPRSRQRTAAGKLATPKATRKTARGKKAAAAKTKASKTYSRRISSDKENDATNAADEPTEASVIEHSEKLEAIRKKFEEVDKFELEFETVEYATTSSSPFR